MKKKGIILTCLMVVFTMSMLLSGCLRDVGSEMVKAKKYMKKQQFDKAAKAYNKILKEEPNDITAKLGRAKVL